MIELYQNWHIETSLVEAPKLSPLIDLIYHLGFFDQQKLISTNLYDFVVFTGFAFNFQENRIILESVSAI
jgi:hypothetical protein